MKIKITGKSNLGLQQERTEEFTVEKKDMCIIIKNADGKAVISFNPIYNGGSVWLSDDFGQIIIDTDGHYIDTNRWKIAEWKENSEKFNKIKEAKKLLEEVE